MSDLKRDEIKYIRDLSKSAYKKKDCCYICDATEDLDFHHFYSMTELWNKWKKKNGIKINSVEDILENRQRFKDEHMQEIYEETVTLCKFHHRERLHKIYGKTPSLATALKQKNWVEKQRLKHNS
jgi:hypothetical protein